jgi:hypothetical protein
MVFPLLIAGAAVGLAGGGILAGRSFGTQAGKGASTLLLVLVAGFMVFLVLKKKKVL